MTVGDVLLLVFGAATTATALASAIQTVILPRAARNRISGAVFLTNYRLFRTVAERRRTFAGRDGVMALFAPTAAWPVAPQAQVMIRSGYIALRRIADGFGIPYDSDPVPTDPVAVTRDEFEAALDQLDAAGLPLRPDRDQSWRDFAGWRVNYDRVLLSLSALTMAPYAPWSSDRSMADWRRAPALVPWGRRFKQRAAAS